MRLSCTVMEIWRLKSWTDGRTHARTDGRSSDFILCLMLYIALNRQNVHVFVPLSFNLKFEKVSLAFLAEILPERAMTLG